MRSRAVAGYTLLFFLSGATGLVYELVWVRLLYQAFGTTVQSVATVVAAYMGGLGLGAWILGRRADRHPRPARLYGILEILIGLFGLASPFLLHATQEVYIGLARALGLTAGGVSVALRFGLAGLVLLIPTTLMGGTLPVLTRALTRNRIDLRATLGRLYGVNTLGAVVGTVATGFWLIERFGIRGSLWGVGLVNLGIGAVAVGLAGKGEVSLSGAGLVAGREGRIPGEFSPLRGLPRLALGLLAVTAFAALLNEIAWTRVLVMIVGGSTYGFTLILVVFLLGIGIGSALVARRGSPPLDTAATATLAMGVSTAGAALVVVALSGLPMLLLLMLRPPSVTAWSVLLQMGLAIGVIVLPSTIGMGMAFPLLTDIAAKSEEASGEDVGRAYGLNTIGSITGAVLTGFALIVALGTDRTLRLGIAVLGCAGVSLAAFILVRGRRLLEHGPVRTRILAGGTLAVLGVTAAVAAPRWSTRLIDMGPTIYGRGLATPELRKAFLRHGGNRQLAFFEGRNTTISVWEGTVGRTLKVNGKVDASDFGDMDTQVMLGFAPIAFRKNARSALTIGFGSGVTAAVLAAAPGMERVEVVELEPAVLRVAALFRSVNDDVLARPNVRTVTDDARSALQLTDQRFDIIVSEPSNPWVAGVATLYTPEFYDIVRHHLTPGGVFGQWVQLYQLPMDVVAGIVRNERHVFPHVQVYFGAAADILVLGSDAPLLADSTWVRQLIGPGGPLARVAHEYLGIDEAAQLQDRRVLGESGIARLLSGPAFVHDDDHPTLEFVAARGFFEAGPAWVFDSLIAVSARAGERPSPPFGLGRVLLLGANNTMALPYVVAAHQAAPDDERWTIALAELGMRLGDSSFADSALDPILLHTRDPTALLVGGERALRRHRDDEARALLVRALAAGADTAAARAALAVLDVRGGRWQEAAVGIREAVATFHDTYRSPFPRDLLAEALPRLALQGPAALADRVLSDVVRARPSWARAYDLRAAAALRSHACEVAYAQYLTLLQFGVDRTNGLEQIRRCRMSE